MGFHVQDARSALMEHQWDPQRAIHHLLSSNKTGMMAPPVMESSSTITTASTTNNLTTAIAPTQPKSNIVTSNQKDHPSIQSKKETKKKQINTTVTPNASLSFPKKKMSLELQEKLKAQKSRLTMVILGHVDHGKSTLMGQVLVQTGVVDKRIVSKYEKQGKGYLSVYIYALVDSISWCSNRTYIICAIFVQREKLVNRLLH